MKQVSFMVVIAMLFCCLAGCGKSDTQAETESIAGYLYIKDHQVVIDRVEIITSDDTKRIKELGLIEERDYPSGYYILNEEVEEETYELSEQTEYEFVDMDLQFVTEEEGDRLYKTTSEEEFLQHLGKRNEQPLEEQTIPLLIEVQGDKVIKIEEKFEYTI